MHSSFGSTTPTPQSHPPSLPTQPPPPPPHTQKRRPLFDQYHQSERAFRAQGWMDDSHHVHYWRYIRRDVAKFLRPDPELDTFLAALPAACPKYIFTNAREEQAEEALECLGVRHHFVGVFGADLMGDVCKPERAAFDKVLAALGEKEEEEAEGDGERSYSNVVFFEDSFKNLMAAKAMGMKTVLIRKSLLCLGLGGGSSFSGEQERSRGLCIYVLCGWVQRGELPGHTTRAGRILNQPVRARTHMSPMVEVVMCVGGWRGELPAQPSKRAGARSIPQPSKRLSLSSPIHPFTPPHQLQLIHPQTP